MSADGQTVIAIQYDTNGVPKTQLWNSTTGLSAPCGSNPCAVVIISGDGKVLIGDTFTESQELAHKIVEWHAGGCGTRE